MGRKVISFIILAALFVLAFLLPIDCGLMSRLIIPFAISFIANWMYFPPVDIERVIDGCDESFFIEPKQLTQEIVRQIFNSLEV